jgi:hypothetical protein
MLRKFALPLLAAAAFASATEVTFSGAMTADVENNLDKSWNSHNSANQDISLTTRAAFDEKTAVELYVTNYSTVLGADSVLRPSVVRSVEDNRSARFDDGDSRWGSLVFDGIQFQWEFSRKAKLLVGDLTWSGGNMNYYGYRWAQEYGSIMKETYVRGIGFDLGGEGQIYLGAPDANNKAIWGFAAYSIPLSDRTDEKWSVRPMGDLVFKNGGRQRRYTLGVETQYSKSTGSLDYAINAAGAMIPNQDKKTYTLLAEPSFNYKNFSLGASLYQAFLANDDSTAASQSDIPEERFAYIEPGFKILPKLAFGLGGEYHDPSLKLDNDEYFACTPNVYLYPSEEMSVTLWSKYRWNMNAGDLLSVGLEAAVEF